MSKRLPPDLTPSQLKAYEILERLRMAWVALIFMFTVFAVVIAALLVAAFTGKGEAWLKIGLLLLDGIVGWGIKRILTYLFPTPAKTATR